QLGQTLQVGSGETDFLGGFFEVRSVSDGSAVLRLLGADQNSSAGTIIPTGSKVTIGTPLNRITGTVSAPNGLSWHRAEGEGWSPSPLTRTLTVTFSSASTILAQRTLVVQIHNDTGTITVSAGQSTTVNGISYEMFGGNRNRTI